MARLPPIQKTIKRLFALSGNQCAFPGCEQKLISDKGHFIGQLCHIEAAEEGGERYNELQNDEQRRSFDNLLLLCYPHHIETNDVNEFNPDKLKTIKSEHEIKFQDSQYNIPEQFKEKVFNSIEKKLNQIYESVVDTNESVKRIENILLLALEKSSIKVQVDEESIYIEELNTLRELRKSNKPRTAIELLLKFKATKWEKLSEETRYRVIANIGIAYVELNEFNNAATQFLEFENINFESEDSLSFLCLAYSILKDKPKFDIAFEKAKLKGPHNVNLWMSYIKIQEKNIPINDIIEQIPIDIREVPEVLFSLGQHAIDSDEPQDGFEYLNKALEILKEKKENVWQIEAAISSTIVKHIVTPFKFIHQHFTGWEICQLNKAVDLFSNSWEIINHTELAFGYYYIIMNRGVTYKVLHKIELALPDLERAYELSKAFMVFKNLYIFYIELKKVDAAKNLIEAYNFSSLKEDDLFEFNTLKAMLFQLQGSPDESVQALLLTTEKSKTENYFQLLSIICATYIESNLLEKALSFSREQIELFPERIEGYISAGYCNQRLFDKNSSIESYNLALALIKEDTHEGSLENLAVGFLELSIYDNAIQVLKRIYNPNIWGQISKKLLIAYYNNGNIDESISMGIHFFERNSNDSFLAEYLSTIYQEAGHNKKALVIIEKYLETGTIKRDTFFYKAAVFYNQLGEIKKLEESVSNITKPHEFEFRIVYSISYFLLKVGQFEKGLELAYQARNKNFDDVIAHENYLAVLNQKDNDYETNVNPEKVVKECIVKLKDNLGNEITF